MQLVEAPGPLADAMPAIAIRTIVIPIFRTTVMTSSKNEESREILSTLSPIGNMRLPKAARGSSLKNNKLNGWAGNYQTCQSLFPKTAIAISALLTACAATASPRLPRRMRVRP